MKRIVFGVFALFFTGSAFAWSSSVTVDKEKGVKVGRLSKEAITGKSKWGSMPTLVLECHSNGSRDLFFRWQDYVGTSGASVAYRFDDEPVVSTHFRTSYDNEGTHVPAQDLEEMLEQMKRHFTLVIQVKDYIGTKLPKAEFFLDDFARHYETACGWWQREPLQVDVK
ncbi:MAG: hypothetical protein MI754_07290 [Chromatiales bacterium]|nr:hypothetical protein [Chromatiales bacterium]